MTVVNYYQMIIFPREAVFKNFIGSKVSSFLNSTAAELGENDKVTSLDSFSLSGCSASFLRMDFGNRAAPKTSVSVRTHPLAASDIVAEVRDALEEGDVRLECAMWSDVEKEVKTKGIYYYLKLT